MSVHDENEIDVNVAISALLDDEISSQDFAKLQSELKSDPVVRAGFVEQLEMHALLEMHFAEARNQASSSPIVTGLQFPTDSSQSTHA